MKKEAKPFEVYPGQTKATNLSIAGGAVKLLSVILMVAAIPCTLGLILYGYRVAAYGGLGYAMLFLLDEMEDALFLTFVLWAAAAACRYLACVLREQAALLGRTSCQMPAPGQLDVSQS